MKLRSKASRRPAKLKLELLEDRITPSSSVIESFEGGLAAYQAAIRNSPGYSLTAEILPIAAHDGSKGLVKQDDYDWLVRNDAASQVHQGDTLSVWVKLADVADGRAYLGFDAKNTGPLHSFMSDSGALSVVMAANTNQLLIESHTANNANIASFSTVASVAQTYQADQWYRLEATWGAGGTITGRLYGSNGTTLLSMVSGTATAPFPTGAGVAFRAFGHDKYFDTVVLDTGSTDTPAQRVAVDPGLDAGWTPGNPPAPVANNPTGGPAVVPWGYNSTPGTGIEIQLQSFNQLQQATPNGIVNGVVGLAGANVSLNTGSVQVGWGEPIETPLLAQYLFRQRPGEQTQLIGASSVKHFFSTVSADFQHLNPGESDPYGSSLNTQQTYYTYGSELDPVTGTLHSQVGRGHINNDGLQVLDTRTFTDRIQYLLQVNVADLDPAQNPAGTRWFLAGNLFVDGEQDVAQASRWVEIVPQFNGATFSFTYPSGSVGQLNFRTIPGLVDPGLTVASATTGAVGGQAFSSILVSFDRAIRPNTLTTDHVSLTGPNGAVAITNANITPIGSTNSTFLIRFAQQGTLGVYTLVIGPDVLDMSGNPMQQAFTTQFTIEGPRIIAQTPSGTNNLPNTVNHVRLTFNEPIDPSTFNTGTVFAHGPNGSIPVTSVTVVAGTNNTQFDVNFASQIKTGIYDVVVLPFIKDPFGNLMDQNQNFIGGELPGDIYVAEFGISGPQVVTTAANSTVAGEVYSLTVNFNEDIKLSSFTTSQIASFTDPNGQDIRSQVFGIVQVSPTNFRQFNVLFTPQTTAGTYTMVIGPNVQDVYGNAMDQDADALLPVETADAATATFTINGPQVVATTPAAGSAVPAPFDHVRVTFNTPVQASTVTTDQVSLTDPNGNPVNIANITPVDFSNGTQYDIAFDPQTALGTYTLTVGPGILDTYGNSMDNPFTATYRIAVTYAATAATFQNIEIFGQAGTQTLVFTSGQVTADDDYGTINLGTNRFTFYGQVYDHLYASSNGLITFGSGNNAFHAANLNGNPAQAAIAPYWTDLIKTGTEPMIVWRINGNQLIIEWYKVLIFDGSPQMTFQTILDLNTGGNSGDIVLNYSNVSGTGDGPENIGVTVGVKDAGSLAGVARTLVEDGTTFSSTGDPRVQTGKALRFHAS